MSGESRPGELSASALAAGMLIGGLSGFAIWMFTGTFVFFPAFLGMGVVIGLVIQAAISKGKDDT